MKESELAAFVVTYLKKNAHEVYQEVPTGYAARSDIVARIPGTRPLWCIETKVSLSWDLLDQALHRQRYFHRVSVAVPKRKKRSHAVHQFCRLSGIGLLEVSPKGNVVEVVRPRFCRKVLDKKINLMEEMKDYAPAGTSGTYYTPFKKTCEHVLRYVTRNPGSTIKAVVAGIDHHYASPSSAKSTIVARIRDGLVPGVEVRSGRPLLLYPKGSDE